ncbi:MAG: sugar phosphate isomerase/epimerase [Oscillospiraceae bacterium]|nr:sugar phosphate isomerase/epimerase [Oscillospiraceae bacterium]
MIKLGVNTVLFKNFDFATAAKYLKKAGYDGVGISALKGMGIDHFNTDTWKNDKDELKAIMADNGLEFLSSEIATQDPERLKIAFEGAAEIGIPVLCIGPGGKMDDEETMKQSFESINKLAEMAAQFKVTLACKAHVGCAVYNTPTSLAMIEAVKNPYFGLDMDPSHIHRANEVPKEALSNVIHAMKHVHIRDCKGAGPSPGDSSDQACGRGDIDLFGYIKAMVDANYDGPCVLEVIGRDLDIAEASIIAAESYGYMNACLKKLGAR